METNNNVKDVNFKAVNEKKGFMAKMRETSNKMMEDSKVRKIAGGIVVVSVIAIPYAIGFARGARSVVKIISNGAIRMAEIAAETVKKAEDVAEVVNNIKP